MHLWKWLIYCYRGGLCCVKFVFGFSHSGTEVEMPAQMSDVPLAVFGIAYSLHRLLGLSALPREKRLSSQITHKPTIRHRFSLLHHGGQMHRQEEEAKMKTSKLSDGHRIFCSSGIYLMQPAAIASLPRSCCCSGCSSIFLLIRLVSVGRGRERMSVWILQRIRFLIGSKACVDRTWH